MNVDDKIYNCDRKAEFIDFYVSQGETDKGTKIKRKYGIVCLQTYGTY